MKKKSRKFAISGIKKVASIILVLSMVFALVGCGEDSESDAKITTEDFGTEEEVKGDVDEPNQEIDEGALLPDTTEDTETTEATTEETSEQPTADNGSYKYTIYDGIEVSLPFDIDDYIITTGHGDLGVQFLRIATECGWEPMDSETASYFYYDCGDYYIYFKHDECYEEECNFPTATDTYHVYQIKSFHYWFSPPSEPGEYYYSTGPSEDVVHSSMEVYFKQHYDKLQLVYLGTNTNSAMSRDDVILIAYVLSFAKNHPGENPLYYLDFSNSNVEHSASAKVYEYIMP